MEKQARIYIAGHQGLIGSAILRRLKQREFAHIITKTRAELDLTVQEQVRQFFEEYRPDYVFLAAGKTGGVYANDTYRAEFIYDNLSMQANVIHQSYLHEVKKLIYFGCSSMYPKFAPQPLKEAYLLSGYPEPTNESFAIAKIAGLKMCESYNRQYGTDFISVIPTNIYGPSENYDPLNCLVVPALIRKFHEAKQANLKEVIIWGTGRPARDFLFVDDLADASIFLMDKYLEDDVLNIASGIDYTIAELADIVKKVIGFKGSVVFDVSKEEGILVKLQDIRRISELGWEYSIELEDGIKLTYDADQKRVFSTASI